VTDAETRAAHLVHEAWARRAAGACGALGAIYLAGAATLIWFAAQLPLGRLALQAGFWGVYGGLLVAAGVALWRFAEWIRGLSLLMAALTFTGTTLVFLGPYAGFPPLLVTAWVLWLVASRGGDLLFGGGYAALRVAPRCARLAPRWPG
jgi:hypothetical protein